MLKILREIQKLKAWSVPIVAGQAQNGNPSLPYSFIFYSPSFRAFPLGEWGLAPAPADYWRGLLTLPSVPSPACHDNGTGTDRHQRSGVCASCEIREGRK